MQIRSVRGDSEIVIGENANSSVFFDSDPVSLTTQPDNLFDVIITQQAKITLQTKIYLGDILFSAKPTDVSVKIFRNNTLLFDGYAETDTYNQPWAKVIESFEINCVDKLSVMQSQYWTDSTSYAALLEDSAIYSFKQILQKIGLNNYNVFFDGSKTVGGLSAFAVCGISTNVFLGESEDKVMSFADILTSVLRYLNLHIMQIGSDFYIFDWQKIANNVVTWQTLFGNGTPAVLTGNKTIDKDCYSDDSTALSMDDVYNQIEVKCNCAEVVDVVNSVLDTGDITNIYGDAGKGQLCVTECWYDGGPNYKEAGAFFRDSQMFTDENSISVSADDATAWHAKDWFMKWQTNSRWTLRYNNSVIDSMVSYESDTPTFQQNLMGLLYDNKFMPALIKLGCAPEINNNNQSRRGSPSMSNYLVISGCAGWGTGDNYVSVKYADKAALDAAIDNAIATAASTNGMVSFESGSALNASPVDDDYLNFIIINGKLSLEPHHCKTGGNFNNHIVRSGAGASWALVKNRLQNYDLKWFGGHNYYSYVNGTLSHYQQVPWTGRYASSSNSVANSTTLNYLSPPVGGNVALDTYYYQKRWTYNQSKTDDGWTTEDTINKVALLECELKIGDKYCVEDFENLDEEGCPTFHWWTATECEQNGYSNKSFTIGINPAIGDYLFGKEYSLTNTADGRRLNYEGLAIPISKADNLVGQVSFKIKSVLPCEWNGTFHISKSTTQSYTHYEGTQNLWAACSALWIKDFSLKFESNSASDGTDGSKDLVYMSDVSQTFTKKKDDIEFNLNTQLTTTEAAELGMSSSVSYSNVINLTTNSGLISIAAPNGTGRAERLFVDQYYNYYKEPKVIVNTQIHDTGISLLNTFQFPGFGKTLLIGSERNLKFNTININCRQF